MRGDPRRRLRRRGQAPDHPRHLRPVQRLLRRLLRPGAEGAHADHRATSTPRSSRPTCWSRRRRRPRRSSWARSSTTRWRCTSTTSRPSRPTSPACPASRCPAAWPTRTACRPASRSWRRRSPTTGCYRVGAALEAALLDAVGRAAARPGPELDGASAMSRRRPGVPSTTRSRVRPGARPRGARRAQHQDQDVLRLPDGVRRRAEHPGLPDLPGPARRAAGRQRQVRSSRRSGSGSRSTARSRSGAGSRGRTTSTRTCRRTSRPRSTTSRSRSRAASTSSVGRRDRSASRSSARTWRRTPASRCTSAAPPAASTAPTTRWSTTTAPASR